MKVVAPYRVIPMPRTIAKAYYLSVLYRERPAYEGAAKLVSAYEYLHTRFQGSVLDQSRLLAGLWELVYIEAQEAATQERFPL